MADRIGLRSKRIGLEVPAHYLHPYHYLRVKDVLGSALVSEPLDLVQRLKMVKSPRELAYIGQAAAIADEAMDAVQAALVEVRS